MIKKLFYIYFFLCFWGVIAQFQKYYDAGGHVYHDVNIEILESSTGVGVIAAGNYFDPQMSAYVPFLQGMDAGGNVLWTTTGGAVNLTNLRLFDIEVYQDFIILTGSVEDTNGLKKPFAAKYDLATGGFAQVYYYDIISSSFPGETFNIKYTEADLDADGTPDPGFILGGYIVISNGEKLGIVLRTDFNLQPLAATEVGVSGGNQAPGFNMVNKVTETSDGYFLTGSVSYVNNNVAQQAVLLHKINFDLSMVWDISYTFSTNQNDVSVDAYYDDTNNEIYALINYSDTNMFGVTVLDNSSGSIIGSQSWYATDANSEKYGFRIHKSPNSNNLIINGYDRISNIAASGTQMAETNIVVYEFDKATGQISGSGYQYIIPNQELGTDDYNFWDTQMPLIYYPEMAQYKDLVTGAYASYKAGYYEDPTTNVPDMALFNNTSNANICDNFSLTYTKNLLPNTLAVNANSAGGLSVTANAFSIALYPATVNVTGCTPNAIDNRKIDEGMLYPNPVQDLLYVKLPEAQFYIIRDLSQRRVKTGRIENQRIPVYGLKKGIYVIEIFNGDKSIKRITFIKK